jgi:hypothetical protein
MRRLLLVGVIAVFAAADCVAAANALTADTDSISGNIVRVTRQDRFRIGPNTGICIETRVDPAVRPRIEASGEHFNPAGWTADPVGQITNRFQELGFSPWIDGGRRRRVFRYIEVPGDASCLTRPDTILIRQHVAAFGPDGYRVSIEASQGDRRYAASLTRSQTVVLPSGHRRGLALTADHIPGLARPFWDVARDVHRLSTPLIRHIFAGVPREGQPR